MIERDRCCVERRRVNNDAFPLHHSSRIVLRNSPPLLYSSIGLSSMVRSTDFQQAYLECVLCTTSFQLTIVPILDHVGTCFCKENLAKNSICQWDMLASQS